MLYRLLAIQPMSFDHTRYPYVKSDNRIFLGSLPSAALYTRARQIYNSIVLWVLKACVIDRTRTSQLNVDYRGSEERALAS